MASIIDNCIARGNYQPKTMHIIHSNTSSSNTKSKENNLLQIIKKNSIIKLNNDGSNDHDESENLFNYKISRPISLLKKSPSVNHKQTNVNNNCKIKIRFLIFIEDSDGSRSNIFDSDKYMNQSNSSNGPSSIKKLSSSASQNPKIHRQNSNNQLSKSIQTNLVSNNCANVNNSIQSQSSNKPNNEMIKRMIFGSFPMKVSSNTAIKVHSLKNSNKTMISNVFTYYNTSKSSIKPTCNCDNQSCLKFNTGTPQATSMNSTNNESVNDSKQLIFKSETIPINSNDKNENKKTTKSTELLSQPSSFKSISKFNFLTSPSSSVPTYYDSYASIYKRIMRSVSNSLISNTTTVNLDQSITNENMNSFSSFLDNSNANQIENAHLEFEKNSLFNLNNSCSNKFICEKCAENNNSYPKYKIGVSIIFCLPQKRNSSSSSSNNSTSTPPLSPNNNLTVNTPKTPPQTSAQITSPLFNSNSINIEKSNTNRKLDKINQTNLNTINKIKSFDQLDLFSLSPNLPSSPINNTESSLVDSCAYSLNKNSNQNSEQHSNDNFYEFFFSHLPLIEYQFKELREKIIKYLPNYFSNNPKYSYNHNQSRNSIVSNNSLNKSISSLNSLSSNYSTTNNLNFSTQMKIEYENFFKKFNFLYTSPRLELPAWLTLINSKKLLPNLDILLSSENKINRSNVNNISDNLINDFAFINSFISNNNPTNHSNNNSNNVNLTNNTEFSFLNKLNKLEIKKSLFFNLSKQNSTSNNNNNNQRNDSVNSSINNENKFLAIILSAVLKNHLSWVYTVLPTNELLKNDENELDYTNSLKSNNSISSLNIKSKLRKQRAHWTRILEKTNPYNPLWAQLGDLHGAVNQPLKLVRTVVIGKNRNLIEKILFILSYFIRCGNSSFFDIVQENFDFDTLANETNVINENDFANDSSNNPFDNLVNNKKVNINSDCFYREVNLSELKFDPISQLTNVLNYSSSSFDLMNDYNQTKKNNSSCSNLKIISSISSASSLASPSSFSSTSSSPFNTLSPQYTQQKNKKERNFSQSDDKNCNAKELPLIGCELKPNLIKSTRMQDNFGYSLLASYCQEFVFEFVLHGTSDRSFLNDLQKRLVFSKNNSILDSPIDESIYLVIDVDLFEVKLYSSEAVKPTLIDKPIELVDSLVQSVLSMIKLFQNSEFVLLHLEDKLQEFYTKSITLKQLKSQSKEIDQEKLMKLMEINSHNDLEFLLNILSAIQIPTMKS